MKQKKKNCLVDIIISVSVEFFWKSCLKNKLLNNIENNFNGENSENKRN